MKKVHVDLVPDPTRCSGCGACAVACPRQAITMQAGKGGFVYPVINHDACIGCGKCVRVCAYQTGTDGQTPAVAYAAVGKCDALTPNSASGGIFATLAMSWIKAGGLVAGAVMDCSPQVQVYHVLSGKKEDIQRMQGSKYVQSEAWRCYRDVLDALAQGRQVLFTGTPCQVAAIKRLTGNPEHLTTIDLICHGVPPLAMLDEYIRLLEKRFRGKIERFSFRDKSVSKRFCARIDIRKMKRTSKLFVRSHELSFYRYFLKGIQYRDNCYTCPYARLERVSDLTIGDYWGVEKQHASDFAQGRMSPRSDWSCILVNTSKGTALLQGYGEMIERHPSQAEWVAAENHQLCHPTVKPAERDRVLGLYEQGGYAAVEKEFIRSMGGELRYRLRLWKHLRALQKHNEGQKT